MPNLEASRSKSLSNFSRHSVWVFYLPLSKKDKTRFNPVFYLFDVGVANCLARQPVTALQGEMAGKSFEHYIFMELTAFLGMNKKRLPIHNWRTKTGLEVDFIIGDAMVTIEVKISKQVHQQDLKGLIAFCEEHPHAKAIVISQDKRPRDLVISADLTIHILPWHTFLTQLWNHEIMG